MKCLCSVYKSPKRDGLYLYLNKADGLKRIPEALLAQFGAPVHCFDLVLTPERRLQQEDIAVVLENLSTQGFHLQMPPPADPDIELWPLEWLTFNDPQ